MLSLCCMTWLAAGLGEMVHQVQQACSGHTHRLFHHDATVAACWDSDRLDLGRVDIDPNPDRLHSDRARELLDAAHERASGEHRPAWIDEKHSLSEAYGVETSKSGFEGEDDKGPSDSDKAKVARLIGSNRLLPFG